MTSTRAYIGWTERDPAGRPEELLRAPTRVGAIFLSLITLGLPHETRRLVVLERSSFRRNPQGIEHGQSGSRRKVLTAAVTFR